MTKMIFINLPVSNLPHSVVFYAALGFVHNPMFSDETGACMVWSETIHVMLLSHDKWKTFTTRPVPPSTSSEVSLALTMDSKAAVDAMNAAAAAHGGTADINPPEEHSFMYGRDFTDPDGHVWGPFWMNPAAMPPADKKEI